MVTVNRFGGLLLTMMAMAAGGISLIAWHTAVWSFFQPWILVMSGPARRLYERMPSQIVAVVGGFTVVIAAVGVGSGWDAAQEDVRAALTYRAQSHVPYVVGSVIFYLGGVVGLASSRALSRRRQDAPAAVTGSLLIPAAAIAVAEILAAVVLFAVV